MNHSLRIKQETAWGEEVFSLLSWFDMELVKNARVMVVGAGALGNEVLKNLALFGVNNIVIVDFDTIERSNLSRSVLFREADAENKRPKVEAAAERLKEINPGLSIMTINGDIGPDVGLGLFREMDVVIGCLDSRYARYLINQHSFRANKAWVDGGIENMDGYVRVFRPGVSCYACSLSPEEMEVIRLRTGCDIIAKNSAAGGRIATTPVIASIIGAIQVQEALKIIHSGKVKDNGFKSLEGMLYKYNGLTMQTNLFRMESHDDFCVNHDVWEPVVSISELSADTSVKEALGLIGEALGEEDVCINMMNNKFVSTLTPESTEKEVEVLLPQSKVETFLANNHLGTGARERIFQDFHEDIDKDFPYLHMTLKEIGIPPYDVIQVSSLSGIHYVLLAGDRDKSEFK